MQYNKGEENIIFIYDVVSKHRMDDIGMNHIRAFCKEQGSSLYLRAFMVYLLVACKKGFHTKRAERTIKPFLAFGIDENNDERHCGYDEGPIPAMGNFVHV